MSENKEEKKEFWSTLFAPKKKSSCCCGSQIEEVSEAETSSCGYGTVIEEVEEDAKSPETVACGCNISGNVAKEVKVLGPGCSKCKQAYKVVEKVIADNNLDVKLTKIEDIAEIMNYNVMSSPAVVVHEVVKIKGHVPSEEEVKKALGI